MEQDMPQVQYIGKCDKLDSIRGVGLHWSPGQVRNVTSGVAERLLHYSDTWVKMDEDAVDDDPIDLAPDDKVAEEPLPVVDFHAMDNKALVEWAETKYNERLDKRQSEDTIRHKVIALFGRYEMDEESK